MPKRPQNHRTGKAAVAKFLDVASERWEVREKSGDYGVDLEIEVFREDDNATGIVAYVQSKGTASTESEPSISVKTETLGYLNSFDVPAILFCYATQTKKSYWMWAHEAEWYVKPQAASVKIKFQEIHLWHDGTIEEIENSLKYNRMLRARSNYLPFPILADELSSDIDPIKLDEVVAGIISMLPFTNSKKFKNGIKLKLSVFDNTVKISAERFVWRSVEALSTSSQDLRSAALYLLIGFWREFGFHSHAERAALQCLDKDLHAPNRRIASEAAISVINRPLIAAKLAIQNDLSHHSDEPMNMFFMALKFSLADIDEKAEAIETFVNCIIKNCEEQSVHVSMQYNFAKFLRSSGKYKEAMFAYNRLRKVGDYYKNRTYFWYEIGGVLYNLRRYKAAAICYGELVKIENIPITKLVLGDALLYSGDLAGAAESYDGAADGLSSVSSEAYLKMATAHWAIENQLPCWPSENSRDTLLEIRKSALGENDLECAFWSHMAILVLEFGDEDCWGDAIFLAMILGDAYLLQAVLKCALRIVGLEVYLKLKSTRVEHFQIMGEDVSLLDSAVRDLFADLLSEDDYEPGVSINEHERLQQEGVFRMTSVF